MKVAKVFACLIIWLLMSNRRYGHNYKNCCVTTQIFLFAWFGVEQFPFFCVRVWMLLGLLFFLSFFFFSLWATLQEKSWWVLDLRENEEVVKARVCVRWTKVFLHFSLLHFFLSQHLSLSLSLTPSLRRVFSLPDTHTCTHTAQWRKECGAAELFHMCRVRQIKLGLVDKGPFTHRWLTG